MSNFPDLGKENVTISQKYAQYVDILIREFQLRLHKFKVKTKAVLKKNIFLLFNIDVDTVPEDFEREVIRCRIIAIKKCMFLSKRRIFLLILCGPWEIKFLQFAINAKQDQSDLIGGNFVIF